MEGDKVDVGQGWVCGELRIGVLSLARGSRDEQGFCVRLGRALGFCLSFFLSNVSFALGLIFCFLS